MPFSLETLTNATIKSVNVRAELHGKDPVPAVDVRFSVTASNNMLDLFDAGLKAVLYKRAEEGDDDQPELDGIDAATDRPVLRSNCIETPLSLTTEYVGRNLVIDYGLGGKSNIELGAVDVNAFKVTPLEGGSVEIEFRVQASGLDGPTLGKIGALVKHDVKITLVSSAEADGTQESIPGADKKPAAGTTPFKFTAGPEGGITDNNPPPAAGAEPDAGAIFAATHGEKKPELTVADVFPPEQQPPGNAAGKVTEITTKTSRIPKVAH